MPMPSRSSGATFSTNACCAGEELKVAMAAAVS